MPYTATFTIRVKSYEIDQYGHVNNAVFMNWLEHGRSQLLQDKGFTYLSITEHWGVRLVTVGTHINFKAQLGLDDEIIVSSTVKKFGRTSVTYDQRIEKVQPDGGRILAGDCETVICFTDPEMKGAVPIPEQFRVLYG